MKARILMLVAALVVSLSAGAQNFWVIETNPKSDFTIVRFYDEQNQLLHEEKIDGKKLDVRSRGDRNLLNRKLKDVTKQKANASARKANKSRKG